MSRECHRCRQHSRHPREIEMESFGETGAPRRGRDYDAESAAASFSGIPGALDHAFVSGSCTTTT